MQTRVTLRPATTADDPLLFRLFAEQRAEEFAPMGLPPALLHTLLESQYNLRCAGYAASHPDARHLVLLADDMPVGQMILSYKDGGTHVVDIVVDAEYRNRGIGSAALQLASASGEAVSLRVRRDSAAARLYDRLGFQIVQDDEMELSMRRPSAAETPIHA